MPIPLRPATRLLTGRPLRRAATLLVAATLASCTTPTASPIGSLVVSPSPSVMSSAVAPTDGPSSPSPAPLAGPGRIVFTEHQGSGHGFTVYTMNPDGSDRKALISGRNAIPRWSPDGRHIAVTLSVVDPVNFETVMNADGSGVRDLARPDPTLSLVCTAWSPDNALLACEGWDPTKAGREGVYTVRASDGGGLKRITTSTGGIHDIPGDFSPDGTQIVFVRATYPPTAVGQLWMASVDGSNTRKIADTLTGYRVSWSRDGRWVAGGANGQLLIFDLQNPSSTPRPIAIPKGIALNPRWSPDGRALVFGFVRTGTTTREVYVVNADGTHPVGLTDEAHLDEYPDWGPST
jgi:Tol biopolymer transport system component